MQTTRVVIDPVEPPKAGWQTTEFWVSILFQILPVLMILRIVNADDAKTLGDAITQCVEAIGSLGAGGGVLWKYIQSRIKAKEPPTVNVVAVPTPPSQ